MSSLPLQYGITRNLLLICILFFQRTNSFCPSKCQCNVDHNLRVSCINAGLEVVPIQLNPDIKYINLTLNQILNVHFTLQFYTQLEVLDLSKNKIDDLGSRNFEAQNQLKTVNLSRNSITHLKKDAFRGLKSLLLLDLSYNQITTVHFTAMHDLSGLIEINLAGNSLTSLDNGIFRNLIALEIVSNQFVYHFIYFVICSVLTHNFILPFLNSSLSPYRCSFHSFFYAIFLAYLRENTKMYMNILLISCRS